jgi:peptidoglycan/LPS O-acetylase OafA/YrhL
MPPEPAIRFVALDSLRGICAVFVAIYHFSTVSFLSSVPFIRNGFLFVDFFFVLSGFVIAASYGNRLSARFPISQFMFLRLGRLYPLHLFVLCLYLAVAFLRASDSYTASGFWTTALLLQTFSDGNLGNWNPPSWSISAEMWTYFAFALMSRYLGKLIPWLLAVLIICIPPMLWQMTDRYLDVCFQGALFRCTFGFSMGVLAFMFWSVKAKTRKLARVTCTFFEMTSVAASLLIVSLVGAGPFSFLCPPVFVLAIYIFAYEGGAVSSLLKTKPIVLLGTLSYSIYMTHLFVQARLLNLIGLVSNHLWLPISKGESGAQTISSFIPFATDFMILLMVSMVIGCGYLTFTYVEEPFRRWSRGVRLARGSITA